MRSPSSDFRLNQQRRTNHRVVIQLTLYTRCQCKLIADLDGLHLLVCLSCLHIGIFEKSSIPILSCRAQALISKTCALNIFRDEKAKQDCAEKTLPAPRGLQDKSCICFDECFTSEQSSRRELKCLICIRTLGNSEPQIQQFPPFFQTMVRGAGFLRILCSPAEWHQTKPVNLFIGLPSRSSEPIRVTYHLQEPIHWSFIAFLRSGPDRFKFVPEIILLIIVIHTEGFLWAREKLQGERFSYEHQTLLPDIYSPLCDEIGRYIFLGYLLELLDRADAGQTSFDQVLYSRPHRCVGRKNGTLRSLKATTNFFCV